MKYITDRDELKEIKHYMKLATKEAKKSTCKKFQRGAVIVKQGEVIGRGYNKPTIEELCCMREGINDNSRS